MKPWLTAALSAAIISALSPSLRAQWPLFPQSGVPKGPDGKPNLAGPAPRTVDGKPDLSGVWIRFDDPDPNGPQPGRPPLVKGGNAGAGFKDGLPFQPWATDLTKKRTAAQGWIDRRVLVFLRDKAAAAGS